MGWSQHTCGHGRLDRRCVAIATHGALTRMKSATIPSLRVAPELRTAAEDVLEEGETLSSFVEQSIRDGVLEREKRSAAKKWPFASASREKAGVTWLGFMSSSSIAMPRIGRRRSALSKPSVTQSPGLSGRRSAMGRPGEDAARSCASWSFRPGPQGMWLCSKSRAATWSRCLPFDISAKTTICRASRLLWGGGQRVRLAEGRSAGKGSRARARAYRSTAEAKRR